MSPSRDGAARLCAFAPTSFRFDAREGPRRRSIIAVFPSAALIGERADHDSRSSREDLLVRTAHARLAYLERCRACPRDRRFHRRPGRVPSSARARGAVFTMLSTFVRFLRNSPPP